jgi:succinyl-CoA synthetase beta subunit
MIFVEHVGKSLLREAGINVPAGELAKAPVEAEQAAARLGACVVKAQVPLRDRGNKGGIRFARGAAEALGHAHDLLGTEIDGYSVRDVLVEVQVSVVQAFRIAVFHDPQTAGPLILVSGAAREMEGVGLFRLPVDIRSGVTADGIAAVVPPGLVEHPHALADVLARLYDAYTRYDAELVAVDPLALTPEGRWVALDCKLIVDDRAAFRQSRLAALAVAETTVSAAGGGV